MLETLNVVGDEPDTPVETIQFPTKAKKKKERERSKYEVRKERKKERKKKKRTSTLFLHGTVNDVARLNSLQRRVKQIPRTRHPPRGNCPIGSASF
jgi:hypothetical protein